jgi:hypothetical protein
MQSVLADACYRVRFQSLKDDRLVFEFPCDAEGRVELDGLNDRARIDYLFARAVVGGEFKRPAVVHVAVGIGSAG